MMSPETRERATQDTAGAGAAGWEGRLALGFRRDGTRTVLTRREHQGPLRMQKALYPEGAALCQCVIVHPPGGIVGGDRLSIDIAVGAGAFAQLTTPGAAKWYRSAGRPATQALRIRVDDAATLEWLPQGTILFDGALARIAMRVDLAPAATFIGWDLMSLGRRASGERFALGSLRQRFEIMRGDALIWSERLVLPATSRLRDSPVGLNAASVFGTLVAVGKPLDDVTLNALRAQLPATGEAAVTALPGVLVARYLGDSAEAGGAYFAGLWSTLRAPLTGRVALPLRIWNT